jgi:hypothetical protein
VELAIKEEKGKLAKVERPSETVQDLPNHSVPGQPEAGSSRASAGDSERLKALEKEVMDLKILNSGKDYFIEQLREERSGVFDQVVSLSRQVGQLETQVHQFLAPRNDSESLGPPPID